MLSTKRNNLQVLVEIFPNFDTELRGMIRNFSPELIQNFFGDLCPEDLLEKLHFFESYEEYEICAVIKALIRKKCDMD